MSYFNDLFVLDTFTEQTKLFELISVDDVLKIPVDSFLSAYEISLYDLVVASKKDEWLAGRKAAKKCIVRILNSHGHKTEQKDIEIRNDDKGVPFFTLTESTDSLLIAMVNGYTSSISHCEGFAVASVMDSSEGGLGVDIEKIQKFKTGTVEAFMNKQEYDEYVKLEPLEQNKWATVVWSLKEAYLKAIKQGLRVHPKGISFSKNTPKNTFSHIVHDNQKAVPASVYCSIYKEEFVITCIKI
ncbi:4'-phosphopantetheinyl transferase superfamily protein [Candidatus Kaiserbacteria bacterium]|nr:4'-phosphopantetheinyl transferase superfamily protein [Candidatus Kaiserbacteria bacterium]